MKESDQYQRANLTEFLSVLFRTLVHTLPETKFTLDHRANDKVALTVTGVHSPEIVFAIINATEDAHMAKPVLHHVNLMKQPEVATVELELVKSN